MSKIELKPISKRTNIVTQELNNEILIYNLSTNKAFCLNETSALVWQACDGNKTIGEISNQVSKQVNSFVSEDFVWLALEQLNRENLIENEPEISVPFEGISRRDLIRRVGMTSLVALPIILSLVAPTAAHAQSSNCGAAAGRSNGCTCTGASNCASNCCGTNGAGNQCVAVASDPIGAVCRAACECASSCCGLGFTCAVVGAKATGAACRVNCECTSGTCGAGNLCT